MFTSCEVNENLGEEKGNMIFARNLQGITIYKHEASEKYYVIESEEREKDLLSL